MKDELWASRNLNMKNIKTPQWTLFHLENALKRLKSNKTRDPHGMINELFKTGLIGFDLKSGILMLLNGIKDCMKIPEFMQWANITSIHKKNGPKNLMDNQRGIFGLASLKKVLDNILFHEYYPEIDKNMSDSNIGGRKHRMTEDHLFILHGVINSVKNGNEDPIEVHIYDIEKAFDKLYLEDTMNDLSDSLPKEMRNDNIYMNQIKLQK